MIQANVTVTFLRMDRRPEEKTPFFPPGVSVVHVRAPAVAFYRYLYDTVGAPYLWWLRRVSPDREIADLLSHPAVGLYVLYADGQPGGFYELDARYRPNVNLSYFGLMPEWVGKGVGYPFLCHAVDTAWAVAGTRSVTVNTCNADHPRALPLYRRAGFRIYRQATERWNVPVRLGLSVADHLRRA